MSEHDSSAAQERQAIPDGPAAPSAPRNLGRIGFIAVVIAIVIAASGLLLRWFHVREVTRWTDARAAVYVRERVGTLMTDCHV